MVNLKNIDTQIIYKANLKELFSLKSPLLWYALITVLLLVYIVLGNQNKQLFNEIFSLSKNSFVLNVIMEFAAQYLFIILFIFAIVSMYITQKGKYVIVIVSFIFIALFAYIFSKIGTHLIADPRPYLAYTFTPLIRVAKDNGFPSDHALLSFAIAACVSLYSKKVGWIALVAALLVGFARVFVGAHHPLDIIGSMVIVILAVMVFIGGSELMSRI